MFETELYANIFKGNMLVELDRQGIFSDQEVGKNNKEIPEELEKMKAMPPILPFTGGGAQAPPSGPA